MTDDVGRKLVDRAKDAGEKHRALRDEARGKAVAAVRALEKALGEALGGEKLRGQPALFPKFCAVRVRGAPDAPLEVPNVQRDPEGAAFANGRPVLVLLDEGVLAMAWVMSDGTDLTIHSRVAEDEDLVAEDVDLAPRAIEKALWRHLESLERSSARYAALVLVAEKLAAAMAA